ncbi:MAG: polyribonucleotide nucleotidyltransferase [bacterium]
MIQRTTCEVGGKQISFETGQMAGQAHGAVVVRQGDTMVLVTVVAQDSRREVDFFPLTVDYIEKTFAAGKIPGGFFKREGRPTEKEIITSRLIDRPIRPLFPSGYVREVQVIATVLSADGENDPDVVALNGASAALLLSGIPFQGPIGGVRVGRVDGQLCLNPTVSQLKTSDLNLVVVGRRGGLIMLEGQAYGLPEEVILEAISTGYKSLAAVFAALEGLAAVAGKPRALVPVQERDEAFEKRVADAFRPLLEKALVILEKQERYQQVSAAVEEVRASLGEIDAQQQKRVAAVCEEMYENVVRRHLIEKKRRLDGRVPNQVRDLSGQVGILPRTHGSALFSRGQTQALVVTTLGTSSDEQRMELLEGEIYKRFMVHYNFPPFSVGEVRPLRSPGRREIGHGLLAERALATVIPPAESFPYTVRVVSDIVSSNGSSSMATVCGGTLSLMDAGVPIKCPVSGIAMGLVQEEDGRVILTDIAGEEDHFGDMDLKIARDAQGIRAIQMDLKISGISEQTLKDALEDARKACLHVLDHMLKVLPQPREEISLFAPRILTMQIKQEKIRDVIGAGGRTVRDIIERTGVKIDIEDSGRIVIASPNLEKAREACQLIELITQEAEIGKIYRGVVKKITNFGAFVEIFPGTEGLVHISQLSRERVNAVTDVLAEGDEVMVKIIDVDGQGRIKLSRKDALEDGGQSGADAEGAEPSRRPSSDTRPRRGRGSRS